MTKKILSIKQHKAIVALLTERTSRQAARAVGVTDKTISLWLTMPAFREALRDAERGALEDATRRLTAGQQLALDTLEQLIEGAKHESTKLTACVQWLTLYLKYRDMKDIDERLSILEMKINGNETTN